MTEFEKKRLAYFIKAAKENGFVQLGPPDADFLQKLIRKVEKAESILPPTDYDPDESCES